VQQYFGELFGFDFEDKDSLGIILTSSESSQPPIIRPSTEFNSTNSPHVPPLIPPRTQIRVGSSPPPLPPCPMELPLIDLPGSHTNWLQSSSQHTESISSGSSLSSVAATLVPELSLAVSGHRDKTMSASGEASSNTRNIKVPTGIEFTLLEQQLQKWQEKTRAEMVVKHSKDATIER
jgi:hypothetical protein